MPYYLKNSLHNEIIELTLDEYRNLKNYLQNERASQFRDSVKEAVRILGEDRTKHLFRQSLAEIKEAKEEE